MGKLVKFAAIAIISSLCFYAGHAIGEKSAQTDCIERVNAMRERLQNAVTELQMRDVSRDTIEQWHYDTSTNVLRYRIQFDGGKAMIEEMKKNAFRSDQ